MQYFPDILTVIKDLGTFAAFAFIFGYFLFKIILDRLSGMINEHTLAIKRIEKLIEAGIDPLDPKGERLINLSDIRSKIIELDSRISIFKKYVEERCTVEHCSLIPAIDNRLEKIKRTIDEFAKRSEESREVTSKYISDIYERINSFIENLGKEMIHALRESRKTNGSR